MAVAFVASFAGLIGSEVCTWMPDMMSLCSLI